MDLKEREVELVDTLERDEKIKNLKKIVYLANKIMPYNEHFVFRKIETVNDFMNLKLKNDKGDHEILIAPYLISFLRALDYF